MSTFAYLSCYVALFIFVASVVGKCRSVLNKPLQMRWELYPVPTEPAEKFEHGGSYLEEVELVEKGKKTYFIGMAKYMAEEVIFLKACFEHNRALWYRTFPFHWGLYLACAFIGLAVVIAICLILHISVEPLQSLNGLIGPIGMLLTLYGATGIFLLRMSESGLKKYSTAEQYLTLGIFIGISALCLVTWLMVDRDFAMFNAFVLNLLTLNFAPIQSSLLITSIVLLSLLTALIPNTHMAHFFMKYFLYHDIRWGDTAASDDPQPVDRSLGIVLNYPVTWSADHVGVTQNRKAWVDVALYNPATEQENK